MTGERAGDSVASSRLGPAMTSPVLSRRQRECLRWAALGWQAKTMAPELGISEQAVKNHLAAAYRKAHTHTLVDTLRAVGWLHVPPA